MIGFDLQRTIETVLTTTVPIVIYMWANRHAAKNEIEKKHQENLELWQDILNERKNFPAHEHWERSGPLTAEGIRRAGNR